METTTRLTRMDFYDEQTAELFTATLVPDGAGYSIHSAGQRDTAAKKRKQQEDQQRDGRHFTMIYRKQPDLSLLNAGYLMRLLPYIESNAKGRLVGEYGKALTVEHIGKLFGKRKPDAIRATMTALEEAGAITKQREGKCNVYFVNPELSHVGPKKNDAAFIKLLKVRARELLQVLTPSEAGFLFKITPYVHFTECFLTKTPDAAPNEELKRFSREELAYEIGVDVMTVTKLMHGLQRKAAILPMGTGNARHYLVNPDVLFRGETEHTPTIRALFARFNGNGGGGR